MTGFAGQAPVVSFTGRASCVSENCGCGGKLVLLPKNLENVAAFSEFLCPPHLLGSNFPPPFCQYSRIFYRPRPLMFRNPIPRHKTAPRICLVETFPLLFLSLLSLLSQAAPLFGDVLTLPVQLRPPEMGIEVDIGAVWRYWEGAFVLGG